MSATPGRRSRRAPLLWAALIVATGLLLGGLLLVPLARTGSGAAGQRLVGQPAPSLVAVDLDGRSWSLEDGRGRLVWINFWASWCPPCRTEIPMMQRLSERYGDRLLILGVNWAEERSTVEDFVERYAITYPVLLDPTLEHFYRWSPQFGLPRHFFVDERGVVVREVPGELPPAAMVQILGELLGP
jgi:thiol-disulfide isomerase/thioredoxin